ncbi:conserved hypothetical protein [Candidatus Glomeribacter gigasporarum BEG34]|uniref:Ribbon-helix-helix protein CopG domain-containing protein n=2 Tax=Candidatus Glomeribacter gigasporarum TaxID=132144 RepID=G2JBF3_9BURK|nr:conserved hypothetical protein [Candidatus Glomeribacter gigasporarum BEG34]
MPFSLRLDEELASFYRRKANEHGISVSEFLRQMLVQGVIAENVQEIEMCLSRKVEEIRAANQSGNTSVIPENVLLSVFTSEALLTAIVESRNPQQLYEAQNIARAKLKQIKDGQMVKRPDKLVGDF